MHALNQVVHFDTLAERAQEAWVRGSNRYLPGDIAIQWCRFVPDAFHSRANAKGRRYAYVLLESRVRPALEAGHVGWTFRQLDGDAMRAAAQALLGTHDFSAFRSAECQSPTPVKTLRALGIARRGDYWRFDFEADAFLHHMIRNIMGGLIAVGSGGSRSGLARRSAGGPRPLARRRDLLTRRPVLPRPVLRCRPCDPRANAGHVVDSLRPRRGSACGDERAHPDQDLRGVAA